MKTNRQTLSTKAMKKTPTELQDKDRRLLVLEDIESDVRMATRNAFLRCEQFPRDAIVKITAERLSTLGLPYVQSIGIERFLFFGLAIWRTMYNSMSRFRPSIVPAIDAKPFVNKLSTKAQLPINSRMAVPNEMYSKDYVAELSKTMKRIANLHPSTENGGRTTIRMSAEIELRQAFHSKQLDDFKARGIVYVVASAHADCSKRCEPWQGKYYALDNKTAVIDGKTFIPIKNATDIFEVTKRGRVWKNGFLSGFNCRHFLVAYQKGMVAPYYDKATIKEARFVNARQRQFESKIREAKTQALVQRGVNKTLYDRERKRAIELNQAYVAFSKEHGVAYYPDRTKIFEEDT